MFLTASAIAMRPLAAGGSDFWDKKPPSEWTNEEIDRLLTKSPWAKEVTAQYAPGEYSDRGATYPGGGTSTGTGYPGGGGRGSGRSTGGIGGIGIPGIGGIGFPGGGGGSRGPSGQPRGGQGSAFHGTVRWVSARPMVDAVKSPLPDVFDGHYVIAVSGIPLLESRYQAQRGEDDESPSSRRGQDDSLENLKSLSSLQIKGGSLLQAGVVRRQVSTGNTILFGFSKEMLTINKRDSEVLFSTRLGPLMVKTHFSPKEMLYHGELAI